MSDGICPLREEPCIKGDCPWWITFVQASQNEPDMIFKEDSGCAVPMIAFNASVINARLWNLEELSLNMRELMDFALGVTRDKGDKKEE